MKAGFALPSVLAVTGMTCLALLAAVTAIEGLATTARETVDRAAFEERALDLEARSTFAALTAPIGSSALLTTDRLGRPRPLLLDGTPYAAAPDLTVSLQDEAGLINLNTLPVADMPGLFIQFGVPPEQAPGLAARLADYIDRDGLVRLGGAEATAYRQAGRTPPPDGPPRDRADLLGVLGWAEAAPPAAWRSARDLIVTNPASVGVNVNTMPAAVLQVLYGLDPQRAARAVSRRSIRPFTSLEDLGRAAGVRLVGDAERGVITPSGRLRFAATSARGGRHYGSRIILTPDDPRQPFRVEDRGASLLTPGETGQAGGDAAPFPLSAN